jgi:hypothetical protein
MFGDGCGCAFPYVSGIALGRRNGCFAALPEWSTSLKCGVDGTGMKPFRKEVSGNGAVP